jgi:hypothetical protein
MARPLSPYRKILVEQCEVISVSTAMGNLALYGITFETLAAAAAVSGVGSAALGVSDVCSSYIARPIRRSSPAVIATI